MFKFFLVLIFTLEGCVRRRSWTDGAPIAITSPIETQLCGTSTEINLDPYGVTSAIVFDLDPPEFFEKHCKIRVIAPKSHLINMEWMDESRELMEKHSRINPPCILSVFLPENKTTPVWRGDICSNDPLPDSDLFTSQVKLIWDPPRYGHYTKGRKLVLTAVGQGNVCKSKEQHTCMRIGWDPILCVSEQLVCDGFKNCPKRTPTSDEDETLCKSHLSGQTSWEQLAAHIFKKLPTSITHNKWLYDRLKDDPTTQRPHIPVTEWREIKKIDWTTTDTGILLRETPDDSVSTALAHYGPWGYLLLGMLFCGTVLMFCGLWECCFRKPKPRNDMQLQQQTPTVLIINQQDDRAGMPPPNYDDLDQPPSYTTLFPNIKSEELNCVQRIEPGRSGDTTEEEVQRMLLAEGTIVDSEGL